VPRSWDPPLTAQILALAAHLASVSPMSDYEPSRDRTFPDQAFPPAPQVGSRQLHRIEEAFLRQEVEAARFGARAQGPAHPGCRRDPASLPATRCRSGTSHLAARRRPASPSLAQARRLDGRQRARCARLHDFFARHRTKLYSTNPLGAAEQRGQAARRCRQHQASIARLIGAVLLEQNDEWLLQHRYMQIEGMADITPPLIDADPAKLPPMAA
jgi:hypothetical protein